MYYRETVAKVSTGNGKENWWAGATVTNPAAQEGIPIFPEQGATNQLGFMDREMRYAKHWLASMGIYNYEEPHDPWWSELHNFLLSVRDGAADHRAVRHRRGRRPGRHLREPRHRNRTESLLAGAGAAKSASERDAHDLDGGAWTRDALGEGPILAAHRGRLRRHQLKKSTLLTQHSGRFLVKSLTLLAVGVCLAVRCTPAARDSGFEGSGFNRFPTPYSRLPNSQSRGPVPTPIPEPRSGPLRSLAPLHGDRRHCSVAYGRDQSFLAEVVNQVFDEIDQLTSR